jgi:peroxiredoxin-like protein
VDAFPHRYRVNASGAVDGEVELRGERLTALRSAPPAQFGGPGDRWSPETLLVAALADCFVLTFRAVARASKVRWTSLECDATGTLDRVDGVTRFTRADLRVRLIVPADQGEEPARRALDKAERNCLISNSLKAEVHLDLHIEVDHLVGAALAP